MNLTWTRGLVATVIVVSVLYSIWFTYADSIVGIGKLFGGDRYYQPWLIIGYFIPSLFMLIRNPGKIEIFIAAFLISTACMDLPQWAIQRVYIHHQALWLQHGNTYNVLAWMEFYYNPLGNYGVWSGPFPTANIIFVSIFLRLLGAGILIWLQHHLEKHYYYHKISFKKLITQSI